MKRFDDTLLTGYIHRALSEDETRRVEALLRDDNEARERVSALRQLQNDIKRGVSAEIDAQLPSHNMTYASIAGTVRQKRPFGRNTRRWQWASRLVGFAAVMILGFAFMYSLGDGDTIQEGGPMVITPTAEITPTTEPALLSITPTPGTINNEAPSTGRTIPQRTPTPVLQEESGNNLEVTPPEGGG